MLIILEGQARTGKTTACQELIRRFRECGTQARIFKSNIRSSNPAAAIVEQLLPLCFDDRCVWICDRAHITERVYSTYYGRELSYDPNILAHCDGIMSLAGTIMFHLVASADVLDTRMKATHRATEGSISDLSKLFEQFIAGSKIMTQVIDTSQRSTEEVTEMIFNSYLWLSAEGDEDDDEANSFETMD